MLMKNIDNSSKIINKKSQSAWGILGLEFVKWVVWSSWAL
jgi:hypothetical protein